MSDTFSFRNLWSQLRFFIKFNYHVSDECVENWALWQLVSFSPLPPRCISGLAEQPKTWHPIPGNQRGRGIQKTREWRACTEIEYVLCLTDIETGGPCQNSPESLMKTGESRSKNERGSWNQTFESIRLSEILSCCLESLTVRYTAIWTIFTKVVVVVMLRLMSN